MAKARILAVDDQRYFRELIEEMLVEEGFEVQCASSGEEALHILERSLFDVVLTDLVMPAMNGAELVQRIKQRDADQEVVIAPGEIRAADAPGEKRVARENDFGFGKIKGNASGSVAGSVQDRSPAPADFDAVPFL